MPVPQTALIRTKVASFAMPTVRAPKLLATWVPWPNVFPRAIYISESRYLYVVCLKPRVNHVGMLHASLTGIGVIRMLSAAAVGFPGQ